MNRLLVLLFVIVTSTSIAIAQPPVEWVRVFRENNVNRFCDVYTLADEGYVMCGNTWESNRGFDISSEMWVVRIDDDGDLVWSHSYGLNDDYDEGNCIVEADNGDLVVGGSSGVYPDNNEIAVWRINEDGEQVWHRMYGTGICRALIELKSGEFLLAGGRNHLGFLICIDGDGDVLWQRDYDGPMREKFTCLRETAGGVVAGGYSRTSQEPPIIWLVKASLVREGEIIWMRTHRVFEAQYLNSMVSSEDGGFALAGWRLNWHLGPNDRRISDFFLVKVDEDGIFEFSQVYDFNFDPGFERCLGIDRLDDGGYAIVGSLGYLQAAVVRVHANGVERWRRTYEFIELERERVFLRVFTSVVRGHDGSIVAAGWSTLEDDSRDAFVIKLEPEILEPQFIYYSPEDTVLSVLLGDSIVFIVRAFDQQGDEMSYLWVMGEDTLSRDTTTTVIFEELSDFNVQCQVSDGEFTVAITWHVSVVEWLIQACTPDSLDLIIRRGTNIDFSLDVAAIEGIELNYLWTHIDRGGHRHEIGETDSVNMLFDLMGNQRMEGFVWHGDRSDEVLWNIDVRSVIWFYLPDRTSLTVPVDTTIEFAVTPFNDNSDSLSYYWTLNEDTLEIEDRIASIAFPDTGLHEVVSYVWDGGEMDSILWEITVIPPVSAPESNVELLPMEPMFYPPSPNPFNSSVSLSFYIPCEAHVTLAIYDISGRLVANLMDAKQPAGRYTHTWNALDQPAGIYLAVWQAGDVWRVEKLVLVR